MKWLTFETSPSIFSWVIPLSRAQAFCIETCLWTKYLKNGISKDPYIWHAGLDQGVDQLINFWAYFVNFKPTRATHQSQKLCRICSGLSSGPVVVCRHFQMTSPLKPLGRLGPNFYALPWNGGRTYRIYHVLVCVCVCSRILSRP